MIDTGVYVNATAKYICYKMIIVLYSKHNRLYAGQRVFILVYKYVKYQPRQAPDKPQFWY